MHHKKASYYMVNGITLYRIITAPLLLALIFLKHPDIFKWLLACSFFTDAIDGYLARKYKVTSLLGARLDSIGDDLTVFVGLVGIIMFHPEFIKREIIVVLALFGLFIIQVSFALIKYGKITTFHTYAAKVAAVSQGAFLILTFFLDQPVSGLFYLAALCTAYDLVEEIILVYLLPRWEANVKGLFWLRRNNQ